MNMKIVKLLILFIFLVESGMNAVNDARPKILDLGPKVFDVEQKDVEHQKHPEQNIPEQPEDVEQEEEVEKQEIMYLDQLFTLAGKQNNGGLEELKKWEAQLKVHPGIRDQDGSTPLHVAAANGNDRVVVFFFTIPFMSNSNIDTLNYWNQTPLLLAVQMYYRLKDKDELGQGEEGMPKTKTLIRVQMRNLLETIKTLVLLGADPIKPVTVYDKVYVAEGKIGTQKKLTDVVEIVNKKDDKYMFRIIRDANENYRKDQADYSKHQAKRFRKLYWWAFFAE